MPPPTPYSPDDSHLSPASLNFLATPEGITLRTRILALLAGRPHRKLTVADIAALRKSTSPDHLHAALTLCQLQPKAAQKFPSLHDAAGFVFATPEALEQATDELLAAHKATRFAPALLPDTHIIDYCSGIGGDSLPLANIAPLTAIDLSPARTTCLRLNAQSLPPKHPLTIQSTDITTHSLSTIHHSLFHIDPARRHAGRRSHQYADLLPAPDFLATLISHHPGGAIKLSPAVDFDSLPGARGEIPSHLELLSHNGAVLQAVLYTGSLAAQFPPNTRTATLLSPTAPPFSFTHQAQVSQSLTPLPQPGDYLYELDGALTRAQLAAPFANIHNLTPLTPDAGYLSSPRLLHHPALTPFQVTALLPYHEKKILAHLRA
ncbi:MAG TPA: hypothetical protein VHQ47_12215, partial [Phycisphaerae bacterium]|nr:hypothetical protein [Phycisphaerae bacterium]